MGIIGSGNARIQKYAVTSEFHREGDVTGRPDACIDNDGVVLVTVLQILDTDPDVVRVEDSLSAADRASCRHTGGRTSFF